MSSALVALADKGDAMTPAPTVSPRLPLSFIEQLISAQGTALPEEAYVPPRLEYPRADIAEPAIDPELSPAEQKEWRRRIALCADRDVHLDEAWAGLAMRHGFTVERAKYWYGEHVRGRGDPMALRPRTRHRPGLRVFKKERARGAAGKTRRVGAGSAELEAVRSTVVRLYRRKRKHRVDQLLEEPALVDLLEEKGLELSYDSLARYVRLNLKADPDVQAAREGRRTSWRPSTGGDHERREAGYPLHIVEVDASPADVLLVGFDGESIVERLDVVYGVDLKTRMAWSWMPFVGSPDQTDFRRFYHRGFAPKDEVITRSKARTPAYGCFGIPTQIVVDRALASAARDLVDDLNGLGCQTMFAPPRTPELKAYVESLIHKVQSQLMEALPGATKENPLKRGGHDAVTEALKYGLTVDRFIKLLDRAFLDGFSYDVITRLRASPRGLWDRAVAEYGAPRVWPGDDASRLRLSLFGLRSFGDRQWAAEGYSVEGFRFAPRRVGDRVRPPEHAELRGDPDDFRTLAVYYASGRDAGRYWGESVNRDIPRDVALSLFEAKLYRRAHADGRRDPGAPATLTEIARTAFSGRKVGRRQATRVERQLEAARRTLRPEAAAALAPDLEQPPALTAPLELPAALDFSE